MKDKSIVSIIILAFVCLFIGFLIGVGLNDIPYLSVAKDIQLGPIIASFLTALVTLGLAFLIPYLITKQIDDSKAIKAFLIAEINTFNKDLEKIKVHLEQCKKVDKITNEDKMEINSLLDYLDKRVGSISQQLNFSFSIKSKTDMNELRIANDAFWKKITGGDLMNENFTAITPDFWKTSLEAYSDYELKIKMLAHKISNY